MRDERDADRRLWSPNSRHPSKTPEQQGTLDTRETPDQIAFELDAYLLLANAQFVATAEPITLHRARHDNSTAC